MVKKITVWINLFSGIAGIGAFTLSLLTTPEWVLNKFPALSNNTTFMETFFLIIRLVACVYIIYLSYRVWVQDRINKKHEDIIKEIDENMRRFFSNVAFVNGTNNIIENIRNQRTVLSTATINAETISLSEKEYLNKVYVKEIKEVKKAINNIYRDKTVEEVEEALSNHYPKELIEKARF